jgi:hypothetical protein
MEQQKLTVIVLKAKASSPIKMDRGKHESYIDKIFNNEEFSYIRK